LMLDVVQLLQFELGTACNLGGLHDLCPNRHRDRYVELDCRRQLDDETILSLAKQAYGALGFAGLVGWAYYNEPLLQRERMFALMDRIRRDVPQSRFLLWTNATLLPEDLRPFAAFERIMVSHYDEARPDDDRLDRLIRTAPVTVMKHQILDDRLDRKHPGAVPNFCLRPFVEFVVDGFGNVHLCCFDWRGEVCPGNVFREPFADIVERWRGWVQAMAIMPISDDAPAACKRCGYKQWSYQNHDLPSILRAEAWRRELWNKVHKPIGV